ncbi:MAG TPA: ATP-binding protein [Bryobacteraceae bacterium]|nr:ATP-binding protein [Bryobacteraceae bacterium]
MRPTDSSQSELGRLFPGTSEMAGRMRAFDWSTNPLGPPQGWPQNLKTSVRVLLTSNHPMLVWWGEQLINLYNDGYAAFLYARHPAALGQPASTVWPEIWHLVGPRVESAIQRDEGTYDEALPFILLRKGHPEEAYVTFSYSPIPNDEGGFGGILCPVTEETRRIFGERQLSLLRELATRTANARTCDEACKSVASTIEARSVDVPFALIYLIDLEKQCAFLTARSGLPVGSPLIAETVPLDAPCLWPLAKVLKQRKALRIPDLTSASEGVPLVRGQYQITEAMAMPILASFDTEPGGILIVGLNPLRTFDDIYEHFLELVTSTISAAISNGRAYESERRRAESLAQLDRAKTAFFSNVSHEFRTPLTLMLGPLRDMLANGNGTLSIRRDELDLVYRNSLRLQKLVNALLDFSRIEANRVSAYYEPTDLAVLTAELASFFRSAIENAGLILSVDCSPLGESVYVDRGMWEKIVLNLLSNAFKFTFKGQILVSLRKEAGFAELSVRDTGVGIPEHELPHVFERFHRVEGVEGRTHEGSGIGLALVQELVRIHGGTVGVKSVYRHGTEFTVSISLGRAHLPAERVGEGSTQVSITAEAGTYVTEAEHWLPDAPRASADEDGSLALQASGESEALLTEEPLTETSGRILLADDNADMRRYLQRLLETHYQVRTVADGEAALNSARADPPDLILSDIMMPRMDGLQLIQQLRKDPRTRSIPVVLISARAGEESQVEGLEIGADEYLVKPFSARELLARIGSLVVLKRTRDALQSELATQKENLTELTRELIASSRALQRSEAYLSEGQRISHTGTCTWNLATGELFWSKEHCRIFGVDSDASRQSYESFLSRIHPEDRHFVRRAADAAIQQTGQFDIEYRIVRPDGSIRNIHASGQPITDHFIEFLSTVMDITDRKRADEEQRKLASVVENSPNLIGFASLQGELQLVNPAGQKLLGLASSEEVQTTTIADCVAEQGRQDFRGRVLASVWREEQWEGETLLKNFKTGALIPTLQHIFLVRDPASGRPVAMATICRDITERKKAEEELRRSEAYLATAERLSHIGSWAWNVSTGELFWSEEHLRILGLDPSKRMPQIDEGLRFIHPEDLPAVEQAFAKIMHEGGNFEVDCRVVRPDGTIRYVHSRADAVFNGSGKLVEYAGTIIDNTERKQAEEALQRATAELAHMARLTTMGELAASIAHEVNQPLSSVVNDAGACVAWLGRTQPNIREATAAASRILEQGIRASEVLSRIRSLLKKSPPEMTVVNMNEIINDVLALTEYESSTRNITVATDLYPDLLLMRGDAVQLKQLLANLVVNAIEAMRGNSDQPRQLFITSQNLGTDQILVTVRDTGVGIDPEKIEELFKPFITHKPEGMGMGLPISRSIIEAHHGRLWANANEDGGATFQFSAPALDVG